MRSKRLFQSAAFVAVMVLAIAMLVHKRAESKKPAPLTPAHTAEERREGRAEAPPSSAPAEPLAEWSLEAEVTQPDRAPAEGAEVWLDDEPLPVARAGADGEVFLLHLTPRAHALRARKGEWGAGPVMVSPEAAGARITLRLHASPHVRVSVRDAQKNAPIPGAHVRATCIEGEAATDAGGLAMVTASLPGECTFVATAAGYAPVAHRATIGASLGGTKAVDFALRAGVEQRGRVVDARGHAVEGASIAAIPAAAVSGDASMAVDEARSDAAGRFAFAALAPEAYRFRATATAFPQTTSALTVVDAAREVTIVLPDGATLEGEARYADGTPAAFASVTALRASAGYATTERLAQVSANERGEFVLTDLPKEPFDLVAVHDEAASARMPIDARAVPRHAVLVLDAVDSISGVVVTPSGEPVANAFVTCARGDAGSRASAYAAAGVGFTTSRGDGQFRVTGLKAGRYELYATWGEEDIARTSEKGRDRVEASTGSSVRLVVRANGTIVGRVKMADGKDPGPYQAATELALPTHFEGAAFRLDDVPSGARMLRIVGEKFRASIVKDAQVPAGGVVDVGDVVVTAGGTLRGRVVRADGTPAAGALVYAGAKLVGDASTLVDSGDLSVRRVRSTTTDGAGQFTLSALDEGAITISASAGRDEVSSPMLVASDAPEPVELVVRTGATITGHVMAHGAPSPGVLVGLLGAPSSQPSPSQVRANTTGPDGAFVLEHVSPGHYSLYASSSGGAERKMVRREIDARAGETVQAELELPSSGVDVEVHFDGVPASLAQAEVILAGEATRIARLDGTGGAAFSEVAPGAYRVCLVGSAAVDAGPRSRCHDAAVGSSSPQRFTFTEER